MWTSANNKLITVATDRSWLSVREKVLIQQFVISRYLFYRAHQGQRHRDGRDGHGHPTFW